MKSHCRARVIPILSQLVLSLLFVTAAMAINPFVARAQEAPSTMQKVAVELTTAPSPAQKASNVIRVKLSDSAGQPITGAEVAVTLSMPAMPSMNMAAMKAVVKSTEKGSGMYEGKADLGSGGVWQVMITARQNGQTIATKKLSLKVAGGM